MRIARRRFLARQVVLLALAIATAGLTDRAIATEWTEREFARFRLLAETTATAGRRQVLIGLEVDLQPEWIFSSKDPGDFGVAPVFDWAASRNLARALVHWPEPRRVVYSTDPPVSLMGYKQALLLPIVLATESADQDAVIRLSLDYALCEDICIVDSVNLSLALPAGAGETTRHGPRLRKALADAKATSW
jgi:suppressor for copper-sensitivity B